MSAAGRFGLAQPSVPFAIKTFVPASVQNQIGFARAPQFWDYQVRASTAFNSKKSRRLVAAFGLV